ncbi:nuclear transport factor 2 family protein [Romeria aff. gracilis LEGE 07310]|uniref:Nuclear transport factor 2 family protein n=1 Tax=Vasconcelosia minhoensis LEGE 07310 TaxID=915328 RepID=A0A8J7AMC1_9CYAN|nr:nuclear transport factor 2 family protein [Romeria gracilis]MBE9077094.1 nuclear transport factor 2 family protein [Romeria aff. gracilis LEGE 07310]
MARRQPWHLLSSLLFGLVLSGGLHFRVEAAEPDTAPAELVGTLEQLETAANAQDIAAVMQLYSPDFSSDDGFTPESLQAALQTLWERYPELIYRVELESWDEADGGYVVETVTYIEGMQSGTERDAALKSVIRSRQRLESGQVVSQETLSERNQLTAGENPPTVTVILPEQVAPGASYDFDAIVEEPLNDRYLLGAAIEEGTTATDFFTGRPIELELLSAGGLFKIGDAPTDSDSRWVSALLIREDGMTVVTRRLRVAE